MRSRSFRRAKAYSKMWRRLQEDRNQHYDDRTCPCLHDPKAMARFKEQPKICSCAMCCNPRRSIENKRKFKLTIQERRAFAA